MRIKIIFFPAAVAVSIAIFIMYVWPEFGNFQKARGELRESEKNLSETQEKKKNITELIAELDQNQSKENYVKSFLPLKRGEEEILNGLNFLATSAGVVIYDISLEKSPAGASPQNKSGEDAYSSKDVIFSSGSESGGTAAREIKPQLTAQKMKIGISGNYENMKNFLDQLYRIEMFNVSESWILSRADLKNKEPETPPLPADLLSLNVDINFAQLGQFKVGNNYAAPIFSQKSFNFSSYEKLESLTSQKIPALEAVGVERVNPFLP
jgi:hypothetical protein